MLISYLFSNPIIFFIWAFALVYAITIHEFAHALSAKMLGDFTAEREGRVSLNPLVHLDTMGTLAILFIGFGWGKPCPYNPYNLRDRKWGPVIIGLAGPFANVISGIIFALIAGFLLKYGLTGENMLVIFLAHLSFLNFALMLFNLIPMPPLDGSKLLLALIPEENYILKQQIQQNGQWILMGLIFFSLIGFNIFGFIGTTGYWIMHIITNLVI